MIHQMPRNSLMLKESLGTLVPEFFIEAHLNVLPGIASEMSFQKAGNQRFR